MDKVFFFEFLVTSKLREGLVSFKKNLISGSRYNKVPSVSFIVVVFFFNYWFGFVCVYFFALFSFVLFFVYWLHLIFLDGALMRMKLQLTMLMLGLESRDVGVGPR